MKLKRELQVKVERVNVHKCDRCSKVFLKLSDLMKHVSYHDKWFLSHLVSAHVYIERAKIFTCDSCSQSFIRKREYLFHKLNHIQSNVRDERKLKRLNINKDVHKPYKCPDCDLKFVVKSTLDEHSILHLPFPHTCDCGIGYYKRHDLIMHMKLVHKTELKPLKPETKPYSTIKKEETVENKNNSKGPKLKTVSVKKKKSKQKTWKIKLINEKSDSIKVKKRIYNIPNPNIEIVMTPDNRFLCPVCKRSFSSKANLFTHYRTHTGDRPYSCQQCDKSYTQSGTLLKHIRVQHENRREKIYKCEQCGKAFASAENKTRHQLIHSVKQYECPFCNKAFHDPSALIRHKRIHTGDKRYRCPYCPKAFTDISGLIGHKLRHDNKLYSCEMCSRKFYTLYDLRKHVPTHRGARDYCCDYCKNYYSNKENLARHIERKHLSAELHKCKTCSKKFISKFCLNKHILRVHKKIRDYECKVCNKRFVDDIKLKAHYLEHNGIRYECNECSQKFSIKRSLIYHYQSVHSGIRCDECLRYFSCQTHLEQHRLKESEPCEICDKKFFCKKVKDNHLKIHYKV